MSLFCIRGRIRSAAIGSHKTRRLHPMFGCCRQPKVQRLRTGFGAPVARVGHLGGPDDLWVPLAVARVARALGSEVKLKSRRAAVRRDADALWDLEDRSWTAVVYCRLRRPPAFWAGAADGRCCWVAVDRSGSHAALRGTRVMDPVLVSCFRFRCGFAGCWGWGGCVGPPGCWRMFVVQGRLGLWGPLTPADNWNHLAVILGGGGLVRVYLNSTVY